MDQIRRVQGFSSNAQRILLSTFLAGFGASAFSLLFNLYLLSLGYQTDFVGLVSSVTTLSTALSGPVVFSLVRRFSYGRLLAAGFVLQAVGCSGQVLGAGSAAIVGFAAVLGISQGLYWAPLPPFLAENSTSANRSSLFSINIAAQLVAGIMGYLFGGQAPAMLQSVFGIAGASGHQATLLAAAAVAGLAMVPMLGIRSHPAKAETLAMPSASVRGGVAPPRRHSARGTLTAMALSAVTMGIATGLAYPFFNVFFVTRHGALTETVGVIFAISAVLSTVAALAAPLAQRRLGYVRAIALTRIGAGASLVVMALSSALPLAVGGFWLRNVMLQTMSPLIDAFGMSAAAPSERGLQAAVTSALWHAGYGLSSLAAGIAIVGGGFVPAFLVAAAVCAVNGVLFRIYFRGWQPVGEP